MRGGRLVSSITGLLVMAALVTPIPSARSAAARMTTRERVGQLVMFSVAGTALSEHERDMIRRHHLGAVILFDRNYADAEQLRRLTAQIQRAARAGRDPDIGALVSVDQEGGIVKRFEDMPPWQSPPEMARRGVTFTKRQGRRTGAALRSVGVNVDLAPVADLDIPPEHVMRERSFGSRPRRVARLVDAFGGGLQDKHVAATAKHFPGLGGATQNTDNGPAYVSRSKSKLRNRDAAPFRAAVRADFGLVMVSHAMYLRDGGRVPASLSPHHVKQRLRGAFRYRGVAVSDALEAVTWRFDGNLAKTCRATIHAGVDLALIVGGVDAAARCAASIRRAVRDGKLSRGRINEAVARVLALKAWLGLPAG